MGLASLSVSEQVVDSLEVTAVSSGEIIGAIQVACRLGSPPARRPALPAPLAPAPPPPPPAPRPPPEPRPAASAGAKLHLVAAEVQAPLAPCSVEQFGESLEAVGLTREEAMARAEEARAGSSTWAGSLLGSGEMLRTSDRKERVLFLVNL